MVINWWSEREHYVKPEEEEEEETKIGGVGWLQITCLKSDFGASMPPVLAVYSGQLKVSGV